MQTRYQQHQVETRGDVKRLLQMKPRGDKCDGEISLFVRKLMGEKARCNARAAQLGMEAQPMRVKSAGLPYVTK
jgi:hypothetical protein